MQEKVHTEKLTKIPLSGLVKIFGSFFFPFFRPQKFDFFT
jgi:hypothetical protein